MLSNFARRFTPSSFVRTADEPAALPAETSIADIGAYLNAGYDARPTLGESDDEGQPNYLSEMRHVAIALGAVAVLRVDLHSDADLVREIETQVLKPRLRYAPMSPGRAPVRLSPDSAGILMPYRLVDTHASQVDPSMWTSAEYRDSPYRIEFDQTGTVAQASVTLSAVGSFVASGHKWRSGLLGLGSPVDLRVARLEDLPLITAAEGVELLVAIRAHVEARGPQVSAPAPVLTEEQRLTRYGIRVTPYPIDNRDARLRGQA